MRRGAVILRVMTELPVIELSSVTGGAPAPTGDNAFGRCGPGTSLKFLGNVYTPQCRAHDAAVRAGEARRVGDAAVVAKLANGVRVDHRAGQQLGVGIFHGDDDHAVRLRLRCACDARDVAETFRRDGGEIDDVPRVVEVASRSEYAARSIDVDEAGGIVCGGGERVVTAGIRDRRLHDV